MQRITAFFLCALAVAPAALAQYRWTPQTGRFINVSRLPKESPELQVEYARTFLVEGDYKGALEQTERFTKFYSDTDYADENQFLRGEIFLAQEDYMTSARAFQQLISAYPDTELYDDVIRMQYDVGDLLYEKGQGKKKGRGLFKKRPTNQAIEVYAMVIDNEPFTAAAAEAQYKVGLSYFALEEYIEAAFEYRRVVEEYSNSDWVDEASHGLAMCYYESSLDHRYDQGPSYLTITAIDRFEGRYPFDDRLEELNPLRDEMRERIAAQRLLTAEFYEHRRIFSSARIYYEVIVKDFADTEALAVAEAWLNEHPVEETTAAVHTIESLRNRERPSPDKRKR